jgi:hypothetical protein
VYNFKRSFIALLGLLALIGTVAALTPFTGHGQQSSEAVADVQDVRVLNTTGNPVQSRIVNGLGAPVPARIVNGANSPVQTRDVDAARASNIVTLFSSGGIFQRVSTDGVLIQSEFTVPAGQVLVVTDVECLGVRSPDSTNNSVSISLGLVNGTVPIYTTRLLIDDDDLGAANDSMDTGFAVVAGKQLEVTESESDFFIFNVILHGYLVPAS